MEAPMEDSAAILDQIYSLKDMLDQVNLEIEQNIQKTRQIESEISKHSEVEKEYLAKECELQKLVLISEFEFSGWIQVTGTASASLQALETKLKLEKSNLGEIRRRFSDKMDKFTNECAQFQDILIEDSKDMALLVEEKEVLQKEIASFEQKINTLQNSTTDYVEEILEEIHRSCSVLEAELKSGITKYMSVLEDIHNLKIIFANTISHQDAPN